MAETNNFFLKKYRNFVSNNPKEYSVLHKAPENAKVTKKPPDEKPKKAVFEKLEIKELPSIISRKKLSAVFLILIGIDEAAKVVKYFEQDELIQIIREVILIEGITSEELREVEKKFGNLNISDLKKHRGGIEYATSLLNRAFGIDLGSKLLIKSKKTGNEKVLHFMEELPPKTIIGLISGESDNVISLVLGLLDPKKAADILKELPAGRTANIIRSISNKSAVDPSVLETVVEKLKKKVTSIPGDRGSDFQGKKKLIEILKSSPLESSFSIIRNLEVLDTELANELKESVFTFEDLIRIPRKSLITALKGFKDKEIAFVLKGVPGELRNFFFECMSKKRKMIIEEEISYLGKVKKSEVDERQKEFLDHLRNLEEKGIIILKPDDDIYVE